MQCAACFNEPVAYVIDMYKDSLANRSEFEEGIRNAYLHCLRGQLSLLIYPC